MTLAMQVLLVGFMTIYLILIFRFDKHIDWAVENKTFNKNKAHKDLYALLRLQYPSVPSALLQTVRDNALEAIKATKFKHIPRTIGEYISRCFR